MNNSTESQEPSFLPILAMIIGGAISTALCAATGFVNAAVAANATIHIPVTLIFAAPIGLVLGPIIFSASQKKWKISQSVPALTLVCLGLGFAVFSSLCIFFQFALSNAPMQDIDFVPLLLNTSIFAAIGLIVGIFFVPLTHGLALARLKAEETQSNRKNLYLALGLFLLLLFALVFFVAIRFS